jgi:pimeloyl-ACP methyl ester carboxylesterase
MAFMEQDGFRLSSEDSDRPELSERVHRHVPGSRFVLAGGGHSTYFERPELFNREVGAFLVAHRPR